MKTCSNKPCENTDIEIGRTICRVCRRLQIKESASKRRDANRDKYNEEMRIYRNTKQNTPEFKAKESIRQANKYLKYKELINSRNVQWRQDNKALVAAYTANYRASKIQRTPPWLTENHLKQIDEIYLAAERISQETGIPHDVDHIVPLRNEYVSGLHVPWNLQVLPAKGPNGNRSKRNKFKL